MASKLEFRLPDSWRRADVITASFFINVLGLGLPIIILQVYDRIIPNEAYSTFQLLMLGLAVAVILETILRIVRAAILSNVGARYEHRTGVAAFSSVLNSQLCYYDEDTAGSYVDRMRGVSPIREFYAGQAALLAVDLPFVLIFLVLIGLIGGFLVLIPLVLLGVLLAMAYYLGRELSSALNVRTESDRRRHDFLIETLQGIHTVKALALEKLMVRRYERLQAKSASEVMNLNTLQSIISSLANTLSQLGTVSFVAIGSLSVINQSMTLGGLAAGTMLTGRILQPVLRGFNFWTRYQSVRQAEEKLDEVFHLEQEEQAPRLLGAIKGHIVFKDVSFRHSKDSPYILKNIDLDVPADSMIGLTGENGCGLSTVLSLINGVYKPESGAIEIDGKCSRLYGGDELRRQMGYMPENGEFFHGTLLENLTMFRDGDAKTRAIQALRLLGLEDFVLSLPQGLETSLGGGTIGRIPRGMRQQIIIARAVVDDPPVLLFDNAHDGLDMESDKRLMAALQKVRAGKTIFLATYRPSFLKMCDRVFILENGRMIEKRPPKAPESVGEVKENSAVIDGPALVKKEAS